MSSELIWEARGLYRRYYGIANDAEVAGDTFVLESCPQFEELRYTILDFLGIEGFTLINPSFIDEAAAIDSAAAMSHPNLKVAVVTDSPEIRELAEQYIAHPLNAYPTGIFASLEEARKWVAIELPPRQRYQGAMRR